MWNGPVPLPQFREVAMSGSESTDSGEPRMEATDKPRLARGLNALIGDSSLPEAVTFHVPIEKIGNNQYQPRKQFDSEELVALTASVKNDGVLQPLVVRHVSDGYQLIAGERRLRAAREAGL